MTALSLQFAFALGGGLGAVFRYLLTTAVTHRFPLSTLLVNVSGCFLLGLGLTALVEAPGPFTAENRRLFVGFCGGFTTFSSFAYQSFDLHRDHSLFHAVVNILANLGLCLVAFLAGRLSGHALG